MSHARPNLPAALSAESGLEKRTDGERCALAICSARGESPEWTNEEHYIHSRARRFVAVATDVATAELIVEALNNLAAHREGGRDDAPDCAHPAGTQNRWTSPEESDDRKASGECVPAGNLSSPNQCVAPSDKCET